MSLAAIPKKRIKELLVSLGGEYRLVAPAREDEKPVFKEIKNVDDIVISDELPYKSPKEFLFPQLERMMSFDATRELKIEDHVEKTIIFGVKPCDLEALKVLKAVLSQGRFHDAWFVRRMENAVFIGMNCISEKPGCFCAERGINKKYSDACDVFLTDTGDHYTVQIITNAGRSLFDAFNLDGFQLAPGCCPKGMTEACCKLDAESETEAESSYRENFLEINAEESIVFNEVDWDRIAEKCMGCGICTYLCPTCHCFAFKDVKEKDLSVRYRVWDSCMYPKFTLHASGHNPRATKKERFRQRVMHKYVYIKKNQGYTACIGCGRCIRSCPVGMNIKSVVSEIMEELDG